MFVSPVRLESLPLAGVTALRLRTELGSAAPIQPVQPAGSRREAATFRFGAPALTLARQLASGAFAFPGEASTAATEDGVEATGSEGEGADSGAGAERAEASNVGVSQEERAQLSEYSKRDREVRAHEQAHKAAGGQFAGSIHLEYEVGPDGKRYAVSGEVPIDVSPEEDPEATLRKMAIVGRAANAPADPSGADRQVAAQAAALAQKARAEMAAERYGQARNLTGAGQPAGQEAQPTPSAGAAEPRARAAPLGVFA
jgi:hypothetical protein